VIGIFGAQNLEEQRLNCCSVDLIAGVEWATRPDGAIDSRVEEIELRMRRQFALGSPAEYRQPNRQQQILQKIEMILDSLAVDAAICGDRLHAKDATLGEGRRLEEAAEGGEVPHQCLVLDLLAQVGSNVALQILGRFVARPC
jgi:hypothetical protein